MVRLVATVILVAVGAGVCFSGTACSKDQAPLSIGVMLPLSGPDDVGWTQPLEWALDAVNDAGGVDGRALELRYVDIGVEDPVASAERLAGDDSVLAVIGPDTSSALFDVAPIFLAAKKPLISPSSTSGDVTRAFAGSRYIWRTTASDIDQLRAMLLHLSEQQVSDVALLTTFDAYGSTFFDWFGFLATELGMNITNVVRMDSSADCAGPVGEVVASGPEVVIVVPGQASMATCVARQMQDRSQTDLLFSDSAMFPALIDELGPLAEGLRGMGLAPDPDAGFTAAYGEEFGRNPVAYAANTYDALLLIVYGLERSNGVGGDGLVDAIVDLTSASGPSVGWDGAGVVDSLALIRDGELPNISGATGDLDFGDRARIDLLSSHYALWRIDDGAFQVDDTFSTDPEGGGTVEARGQLDLQPGGSTLPTSNTTSPQEARTGLWALIIAGSSGWENYRHQADALAQYQLLRGAGLPDERIVLVLADDIASAPENPEPGVVRHQVGGPNLYEDVKIDYTLDSLTAEDVPAILAGQRSEHLPDVIESTSTDNVYVFFSGHGSDQGMFVGADQAAEQVGPGSFVSPETLAATIDDMDSTNRYRRLLVTLEMCEAGAMGRALTAPDALLISAANAYENSLATNYSPDLNAWLGNQFSVALTQQVEPDAAGTLGDLFRQVYLGVSGSHVSAYNAAQFSGLDAVGLSEFFRP